MRIIRRILLVATLCAPAFMGFIGCGPKVYVNEETKVDTTTGEVETYKETRVKN